MNLVPKPLTVTTGGNMEGPRTNKMKVVEESTTPGEPKTPGTIYNQHADSSPTFGSKISVSSRGFWKRKKQSEDLTSNPMPRQSMLVPQECEEPASVVDSLTPSRQKSQ